MSDPKLILVTSGLLSKWGFDDGDPFDDVEEWWHNQHGTGLMRHCACGFFDLGVDSAALLATLVRRFVLPVLDQRVELVDIETSHNPIRASTVDGVDVEDAWYDSAARFTLTPDCVEIPYSTVVEIAAEMRAGSENTDG
jgi:hypothetical protein